MILVGLGDAPVSGGWCGRREPEGEESPDGASRRRAGPAPTGRERLGVCEQSGALNGGVATCTLRGGWGPDRSHSRVHGLPRSQSHRQSSRVAEYTLKLPISCPNNRQHLAQRDAAPVELRHPTARDLRSDRDLTGSRSDLPAPSRPGRPPPSIQPITRPQRAPCKMETAKSFMGALLAERIGRMVKAERPIRLDEATLLIREAAGVPHSSARTRKQMRLGARGAVQRGP